MAIYDRQLRFQFINEALAEMTGFPVEAHRGKTIRDIIGDAAGTVEKSVRKVFASGKSLSNVDITEKLPTRREAGHWVQSYFPLKDAAGRVQQVGNVVVEITKQKKLEESLHELSGQLLRIRDEEQRRLAHKLHDSLNQYQAALKMNLYRLGRNPIESPVPEGLVRESVELLNACIAETRTISYLLHPPLLDEAGLASAMRWYASGFQERSGIKVKLEITPELERLPQEMETGVPHRAGMPLQRTPPFRESDGHHPGDPRGRSIARRGGRPGPGNGEQRPHRGGEYHDHDGSWPVWDTRASEAAERKS